MTSIFVEYSFAKMDARERDYSARRGARVVGKKARKDA
jgi:hypothetical protein